MVVEFMIVDEDVHGSCTEAVPFEAASFRDRHLTGQSLPVFRLS